MTDRDEQFAAAQRHEAEGRQDEARRLYAEIGDVEAMTALGKSLLTRPPIRSHDGVKIIVDAANRGGAEAIYLCGTMSALGAGLQQNWGMALDCMQAAAERGLRAAQEELRLLGRGAGTGWKSLRDAIDPRKLSEPGELRSVHTDPRISVAEQFLAPELCDWLVARAAPKMARARTFAASLDEARNNSVAEFNFVEIDMVLTLVRERIATLSGLPARGLENTQVLHYATGQRFAPHYDFLYPDSPDGAARIAEAGQRVATFLVYLSDDFDGGETEFPKLDWRYRGAKGDAILFWNLREDGEVDLQTLHAGLAPTRGEKWLLSQWIRKAL